MPTKWLQERTNGSKNAPGIGFEGPGLGVINPEPRALADMMSARKVISLITPVIRSQMI